MRIAALYDIHGNAPALRAVLDELDDLRPGLVVVGGDVVGGAEPAEVIDLLVDAPFHKRWVMGAADEAALDAPEGTGLRREHLDLVSTFSPIVLAGGMLFCHDPPADLEHVRQRTVVCGGTHLQAAVSVGEHCVVNAGSVGAPQEAVPGAYWALVEDGDPKLRRTEYGS